MFTQPFARSATAATGINHQINFQGKLVNPNGTNVTDGTYSIVFSIYNVSTGGTALWTETQSVGVSNGIFQVNLGSVTALPGSIDFNTDSIYLGIKVGSDAEMTPRIQFTAVPQAFNAEKLGGLDKTGFIQNQTASQQSASFNISGSGQLGGTLGVVGAITSNGIVQGTQLQSSVATGTAPLIVSSTTLVSNFNADLLDGQQGTYYQNASNINAGTLADARLSSNVVLVNSTQTITGIKTFSNTSYFTGSSVQIQSSGGLAVTNSAEVDGSLTLGGSSSSIYVAGSGSLYNGNKYDAIDLMSNGNAYFGGSLHIYDNANNNWDGYGSASNAVDILSSGVMYSAGNAYIGGAVYLGTQTGNTNTSLHIWGLSADNSGTGNAVDLQSNGSIWGAGSLNMNGGITSGGAGSIANGLTVGNALSVGNGITLGTNNATSATLNSANNVDLIVQGGGGGQNITIHGGNIILQNGSSAGLTSGNGNYPVCINNSGQLRQATSVCPTGSSIAYKTNVQNMGDALSILGQLRPVSFDYKDSVSYTAENGGKFDYGLIAEEVNNVVPTAVSHDEDGTIVGLDYSAFVPFLIKGVQEQQAQINNLSSAVHSLQGAVTTASLQVTGDASVLGTLHAGNLAVSGNGSFGGSLSVGGDLTVSGSVSTQDITINGHVITAGTAPTTSVSNVFASGAITAVVTGNDTSGTITITTGSGQLYGDPSYPATADLADGLDAVNVAFDTPFGSTPRVLLSAGNAAAGKLGIATDGESSSGFSINLSQLPKAGQTYKFTYWAVK